MRLRGAARAPCSSLQVKQASRNGAAKIVQHETTSHAALTGHPQSTPHRSRQWAVTLGNNALLRSHLNVDLEVKSLTWVNLALASS